MYGGGGKGVYNVLYFQKSRGQELTLGSQMPPNETLVTCIYMYYCEGSERPEIKCPYVGLLYTCMYVLHVLHYIHVCMYYMYFTIYMYIIIIVRAASVLRCT